MNTRWGRRLERWMLQRKPPSGTNADSSRVLWGHGSLLRGERARSRYGASRARTWTSSYTGPSPKHLHAGPLRRAPAVDATLGPCLGTTLSRTWNTTTPI